MRRQIIAVLVFGLGGAAILLGLCKWQLDRLDWKLGIIATLEQRLSADPVPLPAAPDEASDEYRRVTVTGHYLPGEAHVLSSAQPWGVGFRIVAAYETTDGRRVLVDRGYVPEAQKSAVRDLPQVAVAGALLWPDEVTSSTPEPDLAKNFWFGRDPARIGAQLGTEPVMIVAESNPGEWPKARPVTVEVRNDHLEYAITWGSLAAVWLGMTFIVLQRIRRKGGI